MNLAEVLQRLPDDGSYDRPVWLAIAGRRAGLSEFDILQWLRRHGREADWPRVRQVCYLAAFISDRAYHALALCGGRP